MTYASEKPSQKPFVARSPALVGVLCVTILVFFLVITYYQRVSGRALLLRTSIPPSVSSNLSETEKVTAMRTVVDENAANSPEEMVLAHLYLKRAISTEEYDNLKDAYGFLSGPSSSILLSDADAVRGVTLSPDTKPLPSSIELLQSQSSLEGPISIEMLSVYAAARSLQSLWSDYPNIIRAIGIAGSSSGRIDLWLPVRSNEPL